MTTSSAQSVTITARDLRLLLTATLPFAGTDRDLPVLNAVQLRVVGQSLIATATDRYRVGISRHRFDESAGEFETLLRVADAKRILTVFRPTRLDNPTLTLSTDGESIEVSTDEALDGLAGATLTFRPVGGEYPKVAKLVAEKPPESPASVLGLNPAHLVDFKHVPRGGETLVFHMGADRKALIVTCGDYFIGAVMPRRLDGSSAPDPRDEWRTLLAGEETSDKAKGAAA